MNQENPSQIVKKFGDRANAEKIVSFYDLQRRFVYMPTNIQRKNRIPNFQDRRQTIGALFETLNRHAYQGNEQDHKDILQNSFRYACPSPSVCNCLYFNGKALEKALRQFPAKSMTTCPKTMKNLELSFAQATDYRCDQARLIKRSQIAHNRRFPAKGC